LNAAAACLVLTSGCFAQNAPSTRAEEIERQRTVMSRTPVGPDTDIVERAVLWAYDKNIVQFISRGVWGLTPAIGGMVASSGFGFGLQYLRPDLLDGNMIVRASARVSARAYQLFDFEIGMPRLARRRVFADLYLRHRNYPQVDYYGPGLQSNRGGRSNYRLEDSHADLTVGVLPARWLRLAAVGSYYRPNVGPGTSETVISAEQIYSPQQAPGIDRQTDFWRGGGLMQVDYRDNPYGPRSGGQYYARFDYYRDRQNLGHNFRRLTAELQQFVPLFNRKRVIAARVRTLMSFENPNQQVPFYLQPSLGGWQDLRGFRPFRFYDNNSVAATAEWRWEIASGVDAALFVDAGKVAPRPGLLNFRGLEKSYGGGFRFRAPVSGAVFARLDAAVSRESVTVALVFSDIFAAPAIRTGRELSPPPGRLP
jgi:outer membrane protein assembly factor BamA